MVLQQPAMATTWVAPGEGRSTSSAGKDLETKQDLVASEMPANAGGAVKTGPGGAAAASSVWHPTQAKEPDGSRPKYEAAEGGRTGSRQRTWSSRRATASSKAVVQSEFGNDGRVTEDGHDLPEGRREKVDLLGLGLGVGFDL